MSRKLNTPELLDPEAGGGLWLDWSFYEDVFPSRISAALSVRTYPDPFSNNTKRVCHHAAVELQHLGVVDLGWCVTGEPDPVPAVTAVLVDPRFPFSLREVYTDPPVLFRGAGKGTLNKTWVGYYHLIRLTMLALAVRVCEDSTRHRATQPFLCSAANAERGGNGMVVSWPGYSGIDLRQF